MIITIDGPSGTGKSTVAKAVASRLGFIHFDTGAMYRSFTWCLQRDGIDPHDTKARQKLLADFRFDIRLINGERRYFVGGTDVTEAIRSLEVTRQVSEVAAIPDVRHELVAIQRRFGKTANAVFEGRDLGTVVFPQAEVKVFLTASPGVRAKRRYRELQEKLSARELSELSVNSIQQEIEERDHRDSTREVSPLRRADDAHLLDTSDLTIEQVVSQVIAYVTEVRSAWDSSTAR